MDDGKNDDETKKGGIAHSCGDGVDEVVDIFIETIDEGIVDRRTLELTMTPTEDLVTEFCAVWDSDYQRSHGASSSLAKAPHRTWNYRASSSVIPPQETLRRNSLRIRPTRPNLEGCVWQDAALGPEKTIPMR